MRFKIITTIEVEFEKGFLNIINKDTQIEQINNCEMIKTADHILNKSEPQYGIICFTRRDDGNIYKFLPKDADIKVRYNDYMYNAHTHQTIDGRIGRLSKFYRDHGDKFYEGASIIAEYNIQERLLTIM